MNIKKNTLNWYIPGLGAKTGFINFIVYLIKLVTL